MTSPILEEAVAGTAVIRHWTVEEYHRAIETGVLEEDTSFELLDGFIVRKDRAKAGEGPMAIGDRHALVVQRLMRLIPLFDSHGCHLRVLRVQQPIALPPINEPEPDASVVRGSEDDYAQRQPAAADVSAVIEVADSSLARDLVTKLRRYAEAGIRQYVVIDLVHDVVLVHQDPDGGVYRSVSELRAGQTLEIRTWSGQPVTVPVSRLLP
jgi:Uma2 family endonuclease